MKTKMKDVFCKVLCFFIAKNNELRRRSDANLYWGTLFHATSFIHHAIIGMYCLSTDLDSSDVPLVQDMKEFLPAMLTGWNFIFQTVFLALAFTHDVLEWKSRSDSDMGFRVRYWRDTLFAGLVFPTTAFVTATFWCLYLIDRELILPEVMDGVLPPWLNHCVHTNVLVVLALELYLQPRRRPVDRAMETTLYVTVSILYTVVTYSVFFFADRWLYIIFSLLSWWQVCLFQAAIYTCTFTFFSIHYPVNRLIHGDGNPSANTNKRPAKGYSEKIDEYTEEAKTGQNKMAEIKMAENKMAENKMADNKMADNKMADFGNIKKTVNKDFISDTRLKLRHRKKTED